MQSFLFTLGFNVKKNHDLYRVGNDLLRRRSRAPAISMCR
jgi:hypothetical protein